MFEPTPSPPGPPEQTKKRNSGAAMIGLVPKSGFFVNQRKLFEGSGSVGDTLMRREIKSRREAILWHFSKVGKTKKKCNAEADGPVTRSSLVDCDDWAVDLVAANCRVTDERRLSRYALEHIVTLPAKTPPLLLVHNADTNPLIAKAL